LGHVTKNKNDPFSSVMPPKVAKASKEVIIPQVISC